MCLSYIAAQMQLSSGNAWFRLDLDPGALRLEFGADMQAYASERLTLSTAVQSIRLVQYVFGDT